MRQLYQNDRSKSLKKLMSLGQEYGIDPSVVKKFWKSLNHDVKFNSRKDMALPIFSITSGSYQMDTLEQSRRGRRKMKCGSSPYYLVFINVNSRKAFVYPMKNKGSGEVLKALKKFMDDVSDEVRIITSDEDTAYLSDEIQNFFVDNNIQHRTTEDDNHNILGIINRFMRTLRDKNDDRDFTDATMRRYVKAYNESVHTTTNKAPNKFTDDDEREWVAQKSIQTDDIKKKNMLNVGDRVRYVTERTPMVKRRMNLSKGSYKINAVDGNAYILMARDKSAMRMPRYRLVVDKHKTPYAKTIRDDKMGVVDKIEDWDPVGKKYIVKYEGVNELDMIPPINLRRSAPTRLSIEEQRYWKGKNNMPETFKRLKY